MSTPTRYLELSPEQDAGLRDLELSALVNAKVRLRASIIRLNAAGWSALRLASHFKRNPQSVHNDLDRFERHGLPGLTDGKAPGASPKFTDEIQAFLVARLAEDRVWNTALLSEAIESEFKVSIKREAIRIKLRELGYSWKRSRAAPGKTPDPAVVSEHQASLERLKRGLWTAN